MNELQREKLEKLEQRQREIADEIQRLRTEAEKPVPWEPKGSRYIVQGNSTITCLMSDSYVVAGAAFNSMEAAEQAAEWYRFYHRLYKLAEELQDGRVGGKYYVYFEDGRWRFSWDTTTTTGHLFTSLSTSRQAVDIMNRDGWRLPNCG